MKIERMIISFPDMRHIIVDNEKQLANYNLDRCSSIDVTVSFKMDEWVAFKEWRAVRQPPQPEKAPEKPKEVLAFGEHEKYAY